MYYVFFIHSSIDIPIPCFHVLETVSNAGINMAVEIYQDCDFFSFGYMSRSEIEESYASCVFNFLRNFLFSTVAVPVYIPTNSVQEPLSPHLCQHLLEDSHSSRCEVISCRGVVLMCISLMISAVEHLFVFLLAICISSLDHVYSVPLYVLPIPSTIFQRLFEMSIRIFF